MNPRQIRLTEAPEERCLYSGPSLLSQVTLLHYGRAIAGAAAPVFRLLHPPLPQQGRVGRVTGLL